VEGFYLTQAGACKQCKRERRRAKRIAAGLAVRVIHPEGDSKICSGCGQTKSLDSFVRARAMAKGRARLCKECSRSVLRDWYAQNQAHAKTRIKAWKLDNRQRVRNYNRKRSAAKTGELVDPLVRLELDDGICGICREDVDPFDYHIDHIVPLARGGSHTYGNTQVAHPLCNLQKATS
jgi:hypothetical protein